MESESVESSSTAGIDDIVNEQLGISEPSPSPEAAQPDVQSSPDPTPVQEQVTQEPPVALQGQTQGTQVEPTPQTFRIGNRDYTPQEIEAAFTTAQQFGHLQNKYTGLLEQVRTQPQSQQQGQTQAQASQLTPQSYMAQLKAKYEPVANERVKQGLIENDFNQLFPGMTAQLLQRDEEFNQVKQVLGQMIQSQQRQVQQQQSSGLLTDIGKNLNALAQSGDAFAPLKDPQQITNFMNYLWNLNPQVVHLRNPDFLSRQWVAYNRDQYLQTAQVNQQRQMQANQTRLARADATTGSRAPGSFQEALPTPLEQMVQDFWERGQ